MTKKPDKDLLKSITGMQNGKGMISDHDFNKLSQLFRNGNPHEVMDYIRRLNIQNQHDISRSIKMLSIDRASKVRILGSEGDTNTSQLTSQNTTNNNANNVLKDKRQTTNSTDLTL